MQWSPGNNKYTVNCYENAMFSLPVQPCLLFFAIISILLVLLFFLWIIPFFERTILLSLSFQLPQASCLFLLFLCPNGRESDSKVNPNKYGDISRSHPQIFAASFPHSNSSSSPDCDWFKPNGSYLWLIPYIQWLRSLLLPFRWNANSSEDCLCPFIH